MKKFNYDSLKKIKRPVMLVVDDSDGFNKDKNSYRIRILFPDGTSIYNTKYCLESKYEYELDYYYSCFVKFIGYQDLNYTISEMQRYDYKNKFKVKKVIKL